MLLTGEERTALLDKWVKTAPARDSLREARRHLLNAASIFYQQGFRAHGDRYKALAMQIRQQD